MKEPSLESSPLGSRLVGRIPVRNLWLLMLYASDLARVRGNFDALVAEDIDDLPDLIGRLLANTVEHRIRRNLTRSYRNREMTSPRVRGRIDILKTESKQLLSRGEVFCRFQELTTDTTRNRFVRAALERMSRIVSNITLSARCLSLAANLARAGVGAYRPSRGDLAVEQLGRNDSADRYMVALATLSFDLALPTEDAGRTPFFAPDREEVWARRLFEKAVLGFAQTELRRRGWSVRGGVPLDWQISGASEGLNEILPRMVTDIILDDPETDRRIVIDTKFTSILRTGYYRASTLSSGYLYQMYAYLRSQENTEARWARASGMFIHPAIDVSLREQVTIQQHSIAFVTVDLSAAALKVREDLRSILRLCATSDMHQRI